jgi:hypothetical protein
MIRAIMTISERMIVCSKDRSHFIIIDSFGCKRQPVRPATHQLNGARSGGHGRKKIHFGAAN